MHRAPPRGLPDCLKNCHPYIPPPGFHFSPRTVMSLTITLRFLCPRTYQEHKLQGGVSLVLSTAVPRIRAVLVHRRVQLTVSWYRSSKQSAKGRLGETSAGEQSGVLEDGDSGTPGD